MYLFINWSKFIRPRAHAAASGRQPLAKTGTRLYSGRSGADNRLTGFLLRLPSAKKTGHAPGDPFQQEFHAGRGIMPDLRIAPLIPGHDRIRARRQPDRGMVQHRRHDGAQLFLRQ